jgi:putative membrane protein
MKLIPAFKIITSIAIAINVLSCKDSNKKDSDDPKDVAEEHNDAKFPKAKEKDAQFLVDAAEIDLMEIRLSELAETKASADSVKALGKTLLKDHEKSLKEIQEMASKKLITIPTEITSKGKDAYDKLTDKKDIDFDEDYCNEMIDDHKHAIKIFEKASTDCEDFEIKSWANKQLPLLRIHLDKAMNCRDKFNNNNTNVINKTRDKPADSEKNKDKSKTKEADKIK